MMRFLPRRPRSVVRPFVAAGLAVGATLVVPGCARGTGAAVRAAAAAPAAASAPAAGSRGDGACFPVERLPAAQAALARTLLLRASDGEALYTLSAATAAGGLKPISSDVSGWTVPVTPTLDVAALDSLAAAAAATGALRCGPVVGFLAPFGATYPGRDTTVRVRSVTLVLADRAGVDSALARHRAAFAPLGLVPGMEPATVVAAVEHAERQARWRGYGHLFGYPAAAVEFFVAAGARGDSIDAAAARAAGPGVRVRPHVEPRDFRRVETWRKHPECAGCAPTASSFVYAVPRGAPESADDRRLREAAASIQAEYARRRARWVRADTNGVVELWREWRAEAGQAGEGRTAAGARPR